VAKTRLGRNSVRSVAWNRSISPVVVGERTPVKGCLMEPSRPVKTLPLSLRTSSGTP
jgi:hypothetical protein